MSVFARDTFTDTIDAALTSHTGETGATWAKHGSFATGDLKISATNRLYIATANTSMYYASGTPDSPDYDVVATVRRVTTAASSGQLIGLTGRIDTAARNFYSFDHYDAATPVLRLYWWDPSNATQLSADVNMTLTTDVDYEFRMSFRGSLIRCYVDRVQKFSVTDTHITAAGKAGILAGVAANSSLAGLHLDNFRAASVSDLTLRRRPLGLYTR